jgi:hypothetical protein
MMHGAHLPQRIDPDLAGSLARFNAKPLDSTCWQGDVFPGRLAFHWLARARIPMVNKVHSLRLVKFEDHEIPRLFRLGVEHVDGLSLGQRHYETLTLAVATVYGIPLGDAQALGRFEHGHNLAGPLACLDVLTYLDMMVIAAKIDAVRLRAKVGDTLAGLRFVDPTRHDHRV